MALAVISPGLASADPGLGSLAAIQPIFFAIMLLMFVGVVFLVGIYFVALNRYLESNEESNPFGNSRFATSLNYFLNQRKKSMIFRSTAYLVPFTLCFLILRAGGNSIGSLDFFCFLAFYVFPLFFIITSRLGKNIEIPASDSDSIQVQTGEPQDATGLQSSRRNRKLKGTWAKWPIFIAFSFLCPLFLFWPLGDGFLPIIPFLYYYGISLSIISSNFILGGLGLLFYYGISVLLSKVVSRNQQGVSFIRLAVVLAAILMIGLVPIHGISRLQEYQMTNAYKVNLVAFGVYETGRY